jgi:hypothetical protein
VSRLTDGISPPRPGPDSQAPQASPQQVVAPPDQLVTVYMTVAIRTSAGPGPGVKRLPAAEANLLISRKHAVSGDQPPRGYLGQDPQASNRAYDDDYQPHGSRHDDGLRH